MPTIYEYNNEAFSNNTFDLKVVEKTLEDIKHNSFSFLYSLQLDMVDYRRYDLKMSSLIQMNRILTDMKYYGKKYVGFVQGSFITNQNRLEFKRSQYYNKELNLFDVANHPELFSYVYMVFIDGKFFDTISVVCKEDVTYFVFDIQDETNATGIPEAYFKELLNKDASITIFLVPNCSYGIYNTNPYVLEKYYDNLALQRFNFANNLKTESQYITFINNNQLLFGSVITDTTTSEGLLKFYNNNFQSFNDKYIHLNVFGLRHLLDVITIPAGEKYFSIPVQDMPIPKENLIFFRNVNGKKYFAHDIRAKLYYPNMYEVENNYGNEELSVYVLYFDDTRTVGLKYMNELSLYYNFTSNILDKYKNNTIPVIIKNFKPAEFTYDIADFNKSSYGQTRDTLNYKINELKEMIRNDNEVFRAYLNKQITSNGFYLDISKMDLNAKYRTDNYTEITDVSQREVFTEPRYVFIFKWEFNTDLYEMRFFIDGKLWVADKVYTSSKYAYYYIPTNLIKPDSVIEIEKFGQYKSEREMSFGYLGERKLVRFDNKATKVSVNDLFFTTSVGKQYVDMSNFTMIMYDEHLHEVEINPRSFKEITGDCYIKIVKPDLVGVPLTLYVKKHSFFYRWKIDSIRKTGDVAIFDLDSKNDSRYYRVFKDGCFLPMDIYNIDFSDQLTDKFSVGFNMVKHVGDKFIIECTPCKYKQVHYQPTIDERGFVDLSNTIDKPLDLKWYDVYLNGLKLNKKNIDIISPTKIFIKNIKTRKNLVIVEKDRDNEYFSLIANMNSINDYLWGAVEDLRNKIIDTHTVLEDSLEDIMSQVIGGLSQDLTKFYEICMRFAFINPDESQIDNVDVITYPVLFDGMARLLFNPDDQVNVKDYLPINPDMPDQ